MADNYYPMGGVPDFYGPLMNSAAQSLVRMPDGTLAPAPQYSGITSLADVYGGVLPSNTGATGTASLRYDPPGDLAASGGWNQFDDQFNSPAALSPNRGAVRVGAATPVVRGPNGSISLNKDQSRLDPGTALAFAGDTTPRSPALAAIQRATVAPPRSLTNALNFIGMVAPDSFLSGDPGMVDWSVANPGMAGIRGPVSAGRGQPAKAPTEQPKSRSLLDMLMGMGGPSISLPSLPPVTSADPLQKAVMAAQQQGQVYDRSRDPSFNPNGGAHGGSLAGF